MAYWCNMPEYIPPAGLYPGLKRPRLEYTRVYYGLGQLIRRGILWPEVYELAWASILLAGAVAFVSSVSLRVFLAEVPSRLELLSPTRRLETRTSRFTLGINSSQNIRRSVQYFSYIDNDSRTSARFFLTIFIRVFHRTDLSTQNTSAP